MLPETRRKDKHVGCGSEGKQLGLCRGDKAGGAGAEQRDKRGRHAPALGGDHDLLKQSQGPTRGSRSCGEYADNVSLQKTCHRLSGEASAVCVC